MINIQDIIPFMKKGWVAMDKDEKWWWFPLEPYMRIWEWLIKDGDAISISDMFDIAPADDWTKSLIRIKGKNNE